MQDDKPLCTSLLLLVVVCGVETAHNVDYGERPVLGVTGGDVGEVGKRADHALRNV